MGANTSISWCHHTFNPWRGCSRVSEGCRFCYAEREAHRFPANRGTWGVDGTRVIASEAIWREPLAWNRKAAAAGERHRVFCCSLADVFEDWGGQLQDARGTPAWTPEGHWPWLFAPLDVAKPSGCRALTLDDARSRLFDLIRLTPNLDWLLLTKRPENVRKFAPSQWVGSWCGRCCGEGTYEPTGHEEIYRCPECQGDCLPNWPSNCWLGTSIENQATADERIPHLLQVPAAVRFLSIEPLLALVDLYKYFFDPNPHREHWPHERRNRIHWTILGGESGPNARPMHIDWARSIRDQCVAAGVPLHFKQHGEWFPADQYDYDTELPRLTGHREIYVGPKGQIVKTSSPFEHGCPCDVPPGYVSMVRLGKKAAGRLLDGRTWDELPTVQGAPA